MDGGRHPSGVTDTLNPKCMRDVRARRMADIDKISRFSGRRVTSRCCSLPQFDLSEELIVE